MTSAPTIPTAAPTLVTETPTINLLLDAEFSAIKKEAKGSFSKFWKYTIPSVNEDTWFCFEFKANATSSVIVAMSETDENMRFKNADDAYMLNIGQSKKGMGINTLYRGSDKLTSTVSRSYLNGFDFVKFRVQMYDDTITVKAYPNGEEVELLQFMETDPEVMLKPKYLALSGLKKSDVFYQDIMMC